MSLPHPYEPIGCTDRLHPVLVVEGVSGIGKSTLTKALTVRLEATSLHTLPMPHSDWSREANSLLRALPQFAFYLSGLLHASDVIRQARIAGPVIADRYVSSVIACHAAVHELSVAHVTRLLEPFRNYLEQPTHTFYLRCSQSALRERMAHKRDLKQDDRDLFDIPGRLQGLLSNFAAVAAVDPTAIAVDTDDKTPGELADWMIARLEGSGA